MAGESQLFEFIASSDSARRLDQTAEPSHEHSTAHDPYAALRYRDFRLFLFGRIARRHRLADAAGCARVGAVRAHPLGAGARTCRTGDGYSCRSPRSACRASRRPDGPEEDLVVGAGAFSSDVGIALAALSYSRVRSRSCSDSPRSRSRAGVQQSCAVRRFCRSLFRRRYSEMP